MILNSKSKIITSLLGHDLNRDEKKYIEMILSKMLIENLDFNISNFKKTMIENHDSLNVVLIEKMEKLSVKNEFSDFFDKNQ